MKTTVFIMRYCRKRIESLFFALLLLFAAHLASATEVSVRGQELLASEDGVTLSADFNINFNARLEDVVNRGVVLYFAIDFELLRDRWYWFDEQVVKRTRTLELYYHALTRQYRLSTGALHQSFATLDEALHVLSRLRSWQVLEKGEVKSGQTYMAALRLRLDLSQMPKTFQVSALANRDWNLASDWLRWTYTHKPFIPALPSEESAERLPVIPEAAGDLK